jgi:pyrroline-5-carboxylate reductase
LLRRALLAAAASDQIRDLMTATPVTRAVVDRFVAGDSIGDAVRVARSLRDAGLYVTLDYLGESVTDPRHAAATAEQYTALLGKLAAEGLTEDGAVEVSVKPTAVGLSLEAAEPGAASAAGERIATGHIARIAEAAAGCGTTVTLDAEDHRTADATLRIAGTLRPAHPSLGSVVQAALRRTEADVRALAVPGVRVRLVKGAYMEPVSEAFTAKQDVDKAFARCLRILMEGPGYPMIATHDPRLIAITRSLGLRKPADSFEYQMLYGIRTDLQRELAAAGARVRVYVPYGSDWYGYLVRRLAERPANLAFFLRALGSLSMIAILGVGKMGEALLSGLVRAGRPPGEVAVVVRRPDRGTELRAQYGVQVLTAPEAAKSAATLVVAVKPQDMGRALAEIAGLVGPSQLVISIAAGITTSFIERSLGPSAEVPVVRAMPNTPALVDEAMTVISAGAFATAAHLAEAESLLRTVGKVLRLPESQQDAATALSGSGPAYVYYLVEAMVDAGILLGMPRKAALDLVIQAVYGAATMLRDSGEHPVILREAVTSPGGTTISAIRELEKHGVRAAFLAAIEAARDRGKELGA